MEAQHRAEELNENDKADVSEAMERNGMQMIEVLMTRLNNLTSKVTERKKACVQDRNPNSDFCSSLVQGLQQELSDDENEDREPSINSTKEKKVSVFRPRISSREYGIPGRKSSPPPVGSLAVGEVYVTFRGEPSTDFGKKLEHKFDLENGIDGNNSKNGGLSVNVGSDQKRRTSRVGHRQRAGQKKLDDAKALRVKYEKKLLDNLEAFVSRSVTDLVYSMPMGAASKMGRLSGTSPFKPPGGCELPKSALGGNGNDKESRHEAILRASSPSNISRSATPSTSQRKSRGGSLTKDIARVSGVKGSEQAPNGESGSTGPRKNRRGSTLPYEAGITADLRQETQSTGPVVVGDDFLDEQMLDVEEFPIPLGASELNPALLLGLACTRISLSAGEALMSRFAKSALSSWLFVYLFWFIHCKSFQSESVEEQEHLLRRSSAIYVQLLSDQSKSVSRHKDFLFKHYPYLLANAIINGFHYLCPGSRHLYTHAWKRIVYFQCCQVLTGMPDICPISILVHRNQLFPNDAAEEEAFMAKEYNRATVVAAATGVPLAKNAGAVDDVLPPLPGQGSKEKKNNRKNTSIKEGKDNQPIETPAPLLQMGSEINELDETLGSPLVRNDSISDVYAASASPVRLKYPSSKRSRKKKMQQHHHEEEGSLLAPRVMNNSTEEGSVTHRDDSHELQDSFDEQCHDNQHHPDQHSPTHGIRTKEEEYWRDRRAQSLQPLIELTGSRKTLRFNPQVPEEFKLITEGPQPGSMFSEEIMFGDARSDPLARQRKVKFDQSGVSPMIQQYLEHPQPFIKGGRKPERMGRTAPVKWCTTGTSDTFAPSQSRKDIHDEINAQRKAALDLYRSQEKAQRKILKENLKDLEIQRKAVYRGGSVSVGKYSLQLVAEIAGRSNEGARKRDEKAKEKERERLASEKERQKKAIEDQFALTKT